ncbi:hypothetical protein [Methylocystis sp. ATCC 49242]|uniref:hypothetical protein n=1 Tax=Methylocystis sp. ATCC 49242 TaxID=622637 RepID=UPI0011846BE6|nr:hypothetical protein [Methylocystis sp. ATCC 49242]
MIESSMTPPAIFDRLRPDRAICDQDEAPDAKQPENAAWKASRVITFDLQNLSNRTNAKKIHPARCCVQQNVERSGQSGVKKVKAPSPEAHGADLLPLGKRIWDFSSFTWVARYLAFVAGCPQSWREYLSGSEFVRQR